MMSRGLLDALEQMNHFSNTSLSRIQYVCARAAVGVLRFSFTRRCLKEARMTEFTVNLERRLVM